MVSNYVISRQDDLVLKIHLWNVEIDLTSQIGKNKLKRRRRTSKRPQCLPQLLADNASTRPDKCK